MVLFFILIYIFYDFFYPILIIVEDMANIVVKINVSSVSLIYTKIYNNKMKF